MGPARVGCVVVHYGADELTMRCLQALLADDASPPLRVVLVDNGPGRDFGHRVRAAAPQVVVVEPGMNLGFAGGCNLGVRALGDEVDLIALVNSDVIVSPGWLVPLVEAMEAEPGLGAASPKMLLEGRYHQLAVHADRTWCPGWGDKRELAWRLHGVSDEQQNLTDGVRLVRGFWEPDARGVWAGRDASLLIPTFEADRWQVTLRAEAPPGSGVELRFAPSGVVADVPAGRVALVTVPLEDPPVQVINNVGTGWRPDGYGFDLGFLAIDRGQHDTPVDVPAWCGGAVLLRRRYLDETGGFDDRLFLYYEDLELSLRGARAGWRYRLVPSSTVEHRHAVSYRTDPAGISARRERNRLLVLLRHGPRPQILAGLVSFALVTASYLRRDVVAPLVRREGPTWFTVRARLAALVGVARLGPAMLRARWADARRGPLPPWPDC